MTINETASDVVLRVVSWDHPDVVELRQIPNFGDYVDAKASLCFERVLESIE